ncbi:MAG: hypothetical protein H6869_04555 [Rhodospirillales bacterium]|nr:hypothetical protein [Rhodospirillales bacterium]
MKKENDSKKSWLRKKFDSARDTIGAAADTTAKEAREVKDAIAKDFDEIRNEAADFLDHHGDSPIKTGIATAFKARVLMSTKIAAKIGIASGPLAKITVPVSFVAGMVIGKPLSQAAAKLLRTKSSNDNTPPADGVDNKAEVNGTDQGPDIKPPPGPSGPA